jgi:hypothetical protein
MLQNSWSNEKKSYSQSYQKKYIVYDNRNILYSNIQIHSENLRTENHKFYLTSLATFVELSTATELVPVLIVYIGP